MGSWLTAGPPFCSRLLCARRRPCGPRRSEEDAAPGHRRAGGAGGGGGAGARGGLRAVPAARHPRDARGHRGADARARARLPAQPEQAVGDGPHARADPDAGGGLGAERAQPPAGPGRRRRGPRGAARRPGRGEGPGGREDGRDAGGAGAADREERVVLKRPAVSSQWIPVDWWRLADAPEKLKPESLLSPPLSSVCTLSSLTLRFRCGLRWMTSI